MRRLLQLRWVVQIGLGLLVIRLIHLQLLNGAFYRQLADQNRLRLVPESAARGIILDRRGRLLATNATQFRVAVVPQEALALGDVFQRVAAVTARQPDSLRQEFERERSLSFVPATIVSRVPKETALRLEEERWLLPGLLVKPEPVRHYPLDTTASNLLGHLSQPTPDELPLLQQYGVQPKQLIGRLGLEQFLDPFLRGRPGGLMVEVDHRARQVRILGHRPPVAGETITLSIDSQLQSLIEQAFGSQVGACVVLDPRTGEIVAMVSRPGFRPEAFVTADAKTVQQTLSNAQTPLRNRATVGLYQPGSTMKLVTAAAALEHHLITPTTTLVCSGSLRIGDRIIHCWNRDGHGPITLTEALMQSCNVYFMQLGLKLGASDLLGEMRHVGFSRQTGWPLEEKVGFLPQRRLTRGDVALLSIGQGEVLTTPLQMALMVAAFANRGSMVEPWIVRSIGDHQMTGHPKQRSLGWSPDTVNAVLEGMKAVVQQPAGTGHRAYSPLVSIAGKTGTAQTHIPDEPHGWFVGFCPVETPRVAMAIVAEHGGSGGDLPAEIARTICEYVSAPGTL